MTTLAHGLGKASEVKNLPPLSEWESRTFKEVKLTPAGRSLVARIGEESEGRLQIDELREGLRVQARSWVGVVRLDEWEIRILPKLAGDQLGLVRLLETVSGLDALTRLTSDASLKIAGESLLDLVALLFAEACEGVLRRGLLADYVEREDELPVLRGRILADRQVIKRFGRLDRIVCRFDELEHDVDENRLLAATLRVAYRRVSSPIVRRKLARLRAVLDPICGLTEFDLRAARHEISYNRLNSHYEQAHKLAWMFLDALGIDDLLSAGQTSSFAFLLDMNLLFERFVERLVRQVLPSQNYRVRSQMSHHSIIWNATLQRPYKRVIPDLLVKSRVRPESRLAIDAKYKLYDERRLDSSDIYQCFLYAYALGARPENRPLASLILYPVSTTETTPVRLRIQPLYSDVGSEILGLAVPIPAALKEMESGTVGPVLSSLAETIKEFVGGD